MHPLPHRVPPPPSLIRYVPRDRHSHQRQYPFIVIISEWEEWLINICWACQEFASAFCGGLPSARRSHPYVSSFEDVTRSSPPLSIKTCVVSQRHSVHAHRRGRFPREAATGGGGGSAGSGTSADFGFVAKDTVVHRGLTPDARQTHRGILGLLDQRRRHSTPPGRNSSRDVMPAIQALMWRQQRVLAS